jgi:hypothetical protein
MVLRAYQAFHEQFTPSDSCAASGWRSRPASRRSPRRTTFSHGAHAKDSVGSPGPGWERPCRSPASPSVWCVHLASAITQ